ncbi:MULTISPECIES: F0F1 ATP synthase subunit epsilon [Marichromatium]|uniref:ATP synthase epsilon chain n=1 Tax=Marichromatium gracile TaxID=1048 RepID=A0A4R4AKT1_MARGR|nr:MULTISPECIES: F0F1 ATP synthase subunit epsilon [Marichromatium]MBO8086471.1 F0F1 ATP synthase subunit epsilon [Marichromatium sp.]MBK1707765.1 F0F1 ATP synthase subunit epsilon [Marichromatium gracile]RNE92120.1 F0F1 ATP synthase subunit epsilon [Marichromatium sp. AB31]RNE93126.1 F0F1 ATP synthase subunit epsilon [Marichromatium sp. AB32]TCW39754.1 ATP synthase F1 subcomplex epsilon subunit [Marichromatium gracile]
MAMTIHVDIVSAEGAIHSGQATMVYASAEVGEVGIAPRHTAFISRLKPGDVRVENEQGEQEHFYVSGGMLEVQPNVVTVLADTAVRAANLDEAAAQDAKRRAEEALAGQQAGFEYAKAQAELAEAIAQLRAIEKLRKTKRG